MNKNNKLIKCPICGGKDTRRSRRRGMVEKSISMVGVLPYRCENFFCNQRFFRFTPSIGRLTSAILTFSTEKHLHTPHA